MTSAYLVLMTIGTVTAADLVPLNISPTADRASIAVFDWNDRIHVYRTDLTLMGSYTAPGATSVAVGADGRVAIAGRPSGTKEGVFLFGPEGKTSVIDTGEFEVTNVCLGLDHSVWMMVRPTLHRPQEAMDYQLMRQYSWEGQLIGTALPKSTLPSGPVGPSHVVIGGVGCRVFGERVGIYLNYGGRPEGLWVELSLEGKEIGRWSTARVMPKGVSATGIVYGRGWDGSSVLKLDRERGEWVYVESAGGSLIGVDGNDLIFYGRGDSTVTRSAIQQ